MSENTKISIDNMNLHYGSFHALKGINMEIPEKEITAFIGPSGCGKSTLLKSLNRMNDLVEDIYSSLHITFLVCIFNTEDKISAFMFCDQISIKSCS